MMCGLKNQKGFTLIELMVVISIIVILLTIALPRLNNMKRTANTAKIVADLHIIDGAINIFHAKYNRYPQSAINLKSSELCTDDSKFFVSVPTPPTGEYYCAEEIGGNAIVGKARTNNDYCIVALTHSSKDAREDLRRGAYLTNTNALPLTAEYFTGFKSISNTVFE